MLCDENRDPLRAARHLAEDVEVPAVIGFRFSKTALEEIPAALLPNHVLAFISVSQAAGLTNIPQAKGEPRLIWRSTLDQSDAARPLAALVNQVVEPRLRAAGLGNRPMRLALVRSTAGPRDASNVLFHELRFNGKPALDNGEAFRQYVFEPGAPTGIVSALVDFAPDVVVVQGATVTADVILPLEAAWRRKTRPIYLTSSDFDDDDAEFVNKDVARRRRFLGLTNLSSTMTNAELVLHYNFSFPRDNPIARTSASQPSYDAFYVLAYAIESIRDGVISGPALALEIQRLLPPGDRVDVGPANLLSAFQTLRAGGHFDLVGAIGSLDFDAVTGEAPIDYAVICMGLNDRGAASATATVESGLVYDSGERRFVGELRCP